MFLLFTLFKLTSAIKLLNQREMLSSTFTLLINRQNEQMGKMEKEMAIQYLL